ncbi:MAG: hypothetical protein RLZZ220_2122 [Pseudomonadota bacterium]
MPFYRAAEGASFAREARKPTGLRHPPAGRAMAFG